VGKDFTERYGYERKVIIMIVISTAGAKKEGKGRD
jgi:hypothetical protein